MQRPASIHRCRRLVAVPRTPVPRSGRPHRPTTRLTCGDGQRQQRCGCAAGRASPSRPDSECAVCCRAQRRKDSIGAAWAWTRRGGQKRPAPAPPRSGAADGVLCDFCAKLREPQVAWRPWPARHVVSALVSSLLCGPWVTASIRPSSGRFKGVLLLLLYYARAGCRCRTDHSWRAGAGGQRVRSRHGHCRQPSAGYLCLFMAQNKLLTLYRPAWTSKTAEAATHTNTNAATTRVGRVAQHRPPPETDSSSSSSHGAWALAGLVPCQKPWPVWLCAVHDNNGRRGESSRFATDKPRKRMEDATSLLLQRATYYWDRLVPPAAEVISGRQFSRPGPAQFEAGIDGGHHFQPNARLCSLVCICTLHSCRPAATPDVSSSVYKNVLFLIK